MCDHIAVAVITPTPGILISRLQTPTSRQRPIKIFSIPKIFSSKSINSLCKSCKIRFKSEDNLQSSDCVISNTFTFNLTYPVAISCQQFVHIVQWLLHHSNHSSHHAQKASHAVEQSVLPHVPFVKTFVPNGVL